MINVELLRMIEIDLKKSIVKAILVLFIVKW